MSIKVPVSDLCTPLKLDSNRIWRPFKGGKLLDKWLGETVEEDGHYPEEWIASTIRSVVNGKETEKGLSSVEYGGKEIPLIDLLNAYPEQMLGAEHLRTHGPDTGILFKILDSATRLLVQGHPDRLRAKRIFDSDYGKAEAWYVLDTRVIDGEEPYVLFGFKPGITKRRWRELFEIQDIPGILNCLHRIPVKPGDVFFINGGVPHAMGSGVLFAEIMEPTDLTFRMERYSPDGLKLNDKSLHIGAGFEAMFDCFDYQGCTLREALRRWKRRAFTIAENGNSRIEGLLGDAESVFFGMNRLLVEGSLTSFNNRKNDLSGVGRFSVTAVISGGGLLRTDSGVMTIDAGDKYVIPAGVRSMTWEARDNQRLELIQVFPPDIETMRGDHL
jgi:mannose-6-phosphate isomerase